MRAIISGGGTGGHIFPAIAIANAIKERHPDAAIHFVGAQGRMEMEKVPAAGYTISGLPIAGLQRKLTVRNLLRNLQLPLRMLSSRMKVRKILRDFRPDIVVGVGGYASQPTLKAAARMGLPTLLQEQNSYAGLTNKMLASTARVICVAYEGMERFFPADKIVMTGNPVRADIERMEATRDEGLQHFGIEDTATKVVLIVGGSLGARSINEMMLAHLSDFALHGVTAIWQTGTQMHEAAVVAVHEAAAEQYVKVHKFISRMDLAYAVADVVISRAGAIAISELCLVGKPIILIPSPNVAEDHQTKNAQALTDKGAALLVRDADCKTEGLSALFALLDDNERQTAMAHNIKQLARRQAAARIVDQIDKIIGA